jgi:hypothetical protein
MLIDVTATITTDASGDATVYLGTRLRGRVHALKYAPGTIDTGGDLTITGETTGVPILVKANAGTATVWFYPRELVSLHTDGSDASDAFTDIHVLNERIKVVVAQGGNAKTGAITAYIDTPDPY